MADKKVWMRPTERLLAPYVWLAQLEGAQEMDRKSMTERSFSYILSLSEDEKDGESELCRILRLASVSKIPKDIIVGKLPSSMNVCLNEELIGSVKERFEKVFDQTKTIQMPYMFRVSATAYALHLEETKDADSKNYVRLPNSESEIKDTLDILKISNQITEMMIRNMPKDSEYINQILQIMKERKLKDYFDVYPGTPQFGEAGDYRCSVHFGNTFRLEKAKEQARHRPVPVDAIIRYVNSFLASINMTVADYDPVTRTADIDYQEIKARCGLVDERDLVWMKFTKDGYLGVVAAGSDVNHDIPASSEDYDVKEKVYNEYLKREQYTWKHNTSGILVHQLGKEWDETFVLIFPLADIPYRYTRGDIERAVGNMLIEKEVPIIDFYSHNY